VRAAAHLSNQALLLDLAAELPQGLFKLLLVPDDDLQNFAILARAPTTRKKIQRHE